MNEKQVTIVETTFDGRLILINNEGLLDEGDVIRLKEFGDYIIKCGVYGNSDFFVVNNEVMRDGKQRGKWGYAWKRAFPGMESMKVRYPKLEKKPWLLPVCYSKRLLYSTTHRRNTIKREINSAGNIDYDQAHRIREMYKNIGLQE